MSSGAVLDKATAAWHSVAGSSINKIVCKASSREVAGPKKKHVDALISFTNNPHVSIPQMLDMFGERFRITNWVIVFKGLIAAHNLMTLGSERFIQCLATRGNPFPLESFTDRSEPLANEMSRYIQKYARYLTAVCTGYRTLVLDVYRMPRGDHSPFRTMDPAKLMKVNGVLQNQFDILLEMDFSAGVLTNGVINTTFLMLYKDLIKIYTAHNDLMIHLLEKFFEMKKAQCKDVVEAYRKFLTRQDGVNDFLSLAEEVGMDKKGHLNLRQVPEDLLPALEQHLTEMDSIRKSANPAKPSPEIKAASEKLKALKGRAQDSSEKNTSHNATPTFGTNLPSGNQDVLEAQKKRFEELRKRASDKSLNVVVASPPKETVAGTGTPFDDIFSSKPLKSSEDAEFDQIAASRTTPLPDKPQETMSSGLGELATLDQWGAGPSIPPASNNPFASPSDFSRVGMESAFGGPQLSNSPFGTANGLGADILQPLSLDPLAAQRRPVITKPLTGDVDTSLSRAAENLSLELGTGSSGPHGLAKRVDHQWEPPKQVSLTGGPNWQGKPPMQTSTFPAPQPGPTVGMGQPPSAWGATAPGMYGTQFTATQPFGSVGYPQPTAYQPVFQPGIQPMAQPGWPAQQPIVQPGGFVQDPFGSLQQQQHPFF